MTGASMLSPRVLHPESLSLSLSREFTLSLSSGWSSGCCRERSTSADEGVNAGIDSTRGFPYWAGPTAIKVESRMIKGFPRVRIHGSSRAAKDRIVLVVAAGRCTGRWWGWVFAGR